MLNILDSLYSNLSETGLGAAYSLLWSDGALDAAEDLNAGFEEAALYDGEVPRSELDTNTFGEVGDDGRIYRSEYMWDMLWGKDDPAMKLAMSLCGAGYHIT